MNWLAFFTNIINRIPIEKVLIPRPDHTKAFEEFASTITAPESQKEASPEQKTLITSQKPETVAQSASTGVITRRGLDAERLAWQDGLIRGELWLLEGHLKNNCLGCGGDVECCWKHCQNVMDASRETQSMTTDPLYKEADSTAEMVRAYVQPDDIKAGKYLSMYPTLAIEVSKVRTQFDKKVMEHAPQPVTLEEAKQMAAEEAAREVEKRWPPFGTSSEDTMFFNVPEARSHLISKGFVYTLRPRMRKTGKDVAFYGSYYKREKIGDVWVDFIKPILDMKELQEYVSGSGFANVEDWWEAAEGARFLFKVMLKEQ